MIKWIFSWAHADCFPSAAAQCGYAHLIIFIHTHTHTLLCRLTSWLLLLGLLSDSLTRDDLMSARSPSSSEWLSSAKICSLCGSPSSLNGIISSVAHSSGSPPPDNWGIFIALFVCLFKQEISEWNSSNGAVEASSFWLGKTESHLEGGTACEHAAGVFSGKQQECVRCPRPASTTEQDWIWKCEQLQR